VPIEIFQFLLKLLLKQRLLAVYHDLHWLLVATKLLEAKLHSRSRTVGNFGKVRVGRFTSDSATLLKAHCSCVS